MSKEEKIYNWKAKVELKEKISLDETKFIYNEAEKYLKEVMISGDSVISRSTTLIALLVGLSSALIGFTIKEFESNNLIFAYTSLFGFMYLLGILIYISKNIKGINYSITGSQPQNIFIDAFFKFEDKLREKVFYWSVIENYQDKIDKNINRNEIKWNRFNNSMKTTIFFPIFLIIIYLIVHCLVPCLCLDRCV